MAETFTDNREANRFELEVGDHLAYADYRRGEGELVIPYVYADPALRGSGAADRLMRQVKAAAEAEKLTIVPICGYAAAWLRRHADR